jgi:hypothetical protein
MNFLRSFALVLILSLSCPVYSKTQLKRKPSSSKQNCTFTWSTMGEKPVVQKKKFEESINLKIAGLLEVSLKVEDKKSELKIQEFYKDDRKNYILNSLTCDLYLNCQGQNKRSYQGKSESKEYNIVGSQAHVSATIGEREVFNFRRLENDGFEYDYIIYRSMDKKPMGLNVGCHEQF